MAVDYQKQYDELLALYLESNGNIDGKDKRAQCVEQVKRNMQDPVMPLFWRIWALVLLSAAEEHGFLRGFQKEVSCKGVEANVRVSWTD
jgi:hypothetical protein